MSFYDNSQYPRIRLTRLTNFLNRSVDRRFQAHGLNITTNQENALRNLRMHGSMSQTSLAEHTGQDRNSLSRTLAILEKNGLIRKKISENDKRYCEVSITPEGERVHIELMKVLEQWRQEVFGRISPEELGSFVATSEKLMAILGGLDQE